MTQKSYEEHVTESGRIVGKDGYPLAVDQQVKLFNRDGNQIPKANGKGVIEKLERTEKYRGGVVYYRVLGKRLRGAKPANQVEVVRKTDLYLQDAAGAKLEGRKPGRGRIATPERKTVR